MREQQITKTLAAAVANNIALVQSPANAGALTLNGAAVVGGVATLDTQRRIGIASSLNDSARTFVVKGTMQSGQAISENVPGSNGGTASTTQDFFTVTSITIDAAAAGTVTVGTTGVGSTPWIPVDPFMGPMEIGFEGELISGNPTYSVETTTRSPFPPAPIYQVGYDQTPLILTPFAWPTLSGVTGNNQSGLSGTVIAAWRGTLSTAPGSIRFTALQSGLITG